MQSKMGNIAYVTRNLQPAEPSNLVEYIITGVPTSNSPKPDAHDKGRGHVGGRPGSESEGPPSGLRGLRPSGSDPHASLSLSLSDPGARNLSLTFSVRKHLS